MTSQKSVLIPCDKSNGLGLGHVVRRLSGSDAGVSASLTLKFTRHNPEAWGPEKTLPDGFFFGPAGATSLAEISGSVKGQAVSVVAAVP